MSGQRVYLAHTAPTYPEQAPYHPAQEYPEYPFAGRGAVGPGANPAYAGVRELFRVAGMDAGHFGTPAWNPLGGTIKRGDRVVLKPNLVFHKHPQGPGHLDAVLTHGSVIRAVLDYVHIALGGTGEVQIADVPLQSADFGVIVARTGLEELRAFYRREANRDVPVRDLRSLRADINDVGAIVHSEADDSTWQDSVAVDIAGQSMHVRGPDRARRLRVSDYDRAATVMHHSAGRHEYRVARPILGADVVINLPKLKTHCKAGVTIALKNLIGINTDKSWLPHYAVGSSVFGGDEYQSPSLLCWMRSVAKERLYSRPRLHRLARALGMPLVRRSSRNQPPGVGLPPEASPIGGGAWFGNDTLWRTIIDLNRILFYAETNGQLNSSPQRRYLAIVDGIIAGQGQGPISPDPLAAGALLLSDNPVAVDFVGATLLGMDPSRLKQIAHAFDDGPYPLIVGAPKDIQVVSSHAAWSSLNQIREHSLRAVAPRGWQTEVELPPAAAAAAGAP